MAVATDEGPGRGAVREGGGVPFHANQIPRILYNNNTCSRRRVEPRILGLGRVAALDTMRAADLNRFREAGAVQTCAAFTPRR